jgi:hypothetical protein
MPLRTNGRTRPGFPWNCSGQAKAVTFRINNLALKLPREPVNGLLGIDGKRDVKAGPALKRERGGQLCAASKGNMTAYDEAGRPAQTEGAAKPPKQETEGAADSLVSCSELTQAARFHCGSLKMGIYYLSRFDFSVEFNRSISQWGKYSAEFSRIRLINQSIG